MKKKTKTVRVDEEFFDNFMKGMDERFKKGLCERKDLTFTEATRLANRSFGVNLFLKEELPTKRKKKK